MSDYQENSALPEVQGQIDEVTGIMRNNMNKVLDREQKLSDLEAGAEGLEVEANRFGRTSRKLKSKYWWQNLKAWLGIFVVLAILAVIIALIVIHNK
eukprot:Clim_evm1s84 gene=Clim_evmTU1s84